MKKWKIEGKHRVAKDILITESHSVSGNLKIRYTGTIKGWRNWKLGNNIDEAIKRAREIRSRIESGDDSVFQED